MRPVSGDRTARERDNKGRPDRRDEARWLRPKPARCPPRTQAAAKPRGLTGAMEEAWLHVLASNGVDRSVYEQLAVQVRCHLETKKGVNRRGKPRGHSGQGRQGAQWT